MQYAVLSMTGKPLFIKQQLDLCLKIIKIDLLRYTLWNITLQEWNNLMKYIYNEVKNNFTFEKIIYKINNACNKE